MILIMSLWRNDADRDLLRRADHLLSKRSAGHYVRWLWVVGDSDDDTERLLRQRYSYLTALTIMRADTDIEGEDLASRRRRGSASATQMFATLAGSGATLVCLHESDLTSPDDVLDRLVATSQGHPVAGWPTIELDGGSRFYDIWAYRDLQDDHFRPTPPYAKGYRPDQRFEVGGFGSVWLAPAPLVRGRRLDRFGIVDLCRQWRSEGIKMYCDPTIPITQPVALWEAA